MAVNLPKGNQVTTVSDAVHKLQLALLEGIQDETQLLAAGSLMSRTDYQDVVTERSIAKLCGYPLCSNSLPLEQPQKGHYRISLKEHKVYDLHETYMYCGSSCLINSRAFAGSLLDERCSAMNPAKLNEVLGLFENVGLGNEEMGEIEDLGMSKLKIQEKTDVKKGDVSMEDWVGPSNAIEGYVPQRDRSSKQAVSKASEKGSEPGKAQSSKPNDKGKKKVDFKVSVMPNKDSRTNHTRASEALFGEMDFTSTIITSDEYTVSKKLGGDSEPDSSSVSKEGTKLPKKSGSKKGKDPIFSGLDFTSKIITQDEYSISKSPSSQVVSDPNQMSVSIEKMDFGDAKKQPKPLEESFSPTEVGPQSSMDSAAIKTGIITNVDGGQSKVSNRSQNDAKSSTANVTDESCTEQASQSSKTIVRKSSMKTPREGKEARSVTWADKKNNGLDGGNLCDFREFVDTTKEDPWTSRSKGAVYNDDDYERLASAEACAVAMTQAAEEVASGQSDETDAVSEAGIVVLAQPQKADEADDPEEDGPSEGTTSLKWPKKPDNLDSDYNDSEDSWFGAPPEGFSLTLSPFATMWDALFSWMTSSSLAYIYGRDENAHEEYLYVNGREYPSKVMLPDGRSSEIKQTLAGCLARALPGVVTILKLPTPVSTMEQGLACLLDTMSFMDPLPPFRVKQWQVITLLLVDALSICRIPGLAPYLTSRRILIPKVLAGGQISPEEFEIMKDLVIPLGRVPQFSMQSGG